RAAPEPRGSGKTGRGGGGRRGPPALPLAPPSSTPVRLDFDTDAISLDEDRADGDFDGSGHTYPGELLPAEVEAEGIRFEIGSKAAGARNALACRGQTIDLPPGDYNRLYLLAAARAGDVTGEFR